MSNPNHPSEAIIILHGIGMSKWIMKPIATYLMKLGYYIVNQDYPSRKMNIEQLASTFVAQAIHKAQSIKPDKIHFVVHSLGSILVRAYFQNNTLANAGRVVMLGPPNNGSELADAIREWKLYKTLFGPAGQELITGPDGPGRLQPIDLEVGVIAGTKSAHPFNWMLESHNDGAVSLNSTRLPEMKDFISMPVAHTPMLLNKDVMMQVVHFLQSGVFDHEQDG
ncbi:MAG: hypothetical protein PVG66_06155 [Chromatiales bacterium]|jgi:hypothetical protein